MGFFKNFLNRRKKNERNIDTGQAEAPYESQEEYFVSRSRVNMDEASDRMQYIKSLLEQMADAQVQLDSSRKEYKTVELYLKDMEEIDYIPPDEKEQLLVYAKEIYNLEKDKIKYEEKPERLSDADFARMERLEDDTDEGVKRLREAEEYQQAIRNDMVRLENEKQACLFRRQEASESMENLRGMAFICTIAVFVCMAMLLVLQFVLEMNAQIGYILTAAAAAIALAVIYVKYHEAEGEKKHASQSLNKVILLQNRVKIRYVNNTNLLDYLYMKFGISSAKELSSLWERYLSEKDERVRIQETMKELTFSQEQLVRILRKHRLHDPIIWLHQVEALLEPKEMVEVRHALIARRQKLRKQIEFNTANGENAQKEIREIVADYPKYAGEILKMVSEYEDRV